jgi:protein-S-isoprenylcysteine O-methyltransferase Ste14
LENNYFNSAASSVRPLATSHFEGSRSVITYEAVILWSWAAFLLVWVVSAFGVKRDIRGTGFSSVWSSFWAVRLAVIMLLAFYTIRFVHRTGSARGLFSNRAFIFAPSPALGWAAAALTAIGIGLAIWARVVLGRNWSPQPAVKEHHELVTTGPYAYVRHPIYTGVLLAAFGTALTGTIFGIGVFIVASIIFLSRIGREEKIMLELFPNEYPGYRARTKRLVPFIW